MSWNDQARAELKELLYAFLGGTAIRDDVLCFEAALAHDCALAPDLRHVLSTLALIGEEVDVDWRPPSDFDDAVRESISTLSSELASEPASVIAAD